MYCGNPIIGCSSSTVWIMDRERMRTSGAMLAMLFMHREVEDTSDTGIQAFQCTETTFLRIV